MGTGWAFVRVGTSCVVLAVSVLLIVGCDRSMSQANTVPGLPSPDPPSQTNTYVGTQSPGDIWKITIDHVANSFSFADLSSGTPPATVNGLFANDAGFLDFNQTNTSPIFQPAGFALEILGRAALLRPGANTTPIVPLVLQSNCPTSNGPVTLQFVALPNSVWAAATNTAYGSLQVSTNGTTFNFSQLQQFLLAGSPNQPGASLSAGVCAQSPVGNVISIPPSPTISQTGTMALGPSGFFLVDEGSGNPGEIGVAQPATALSTASVVNSQYLGFMYTPAAGLAGLPVTQMAAFGCSASSAASSGSVCPTPPSPTSIVGGVFASDDPTQPANTDTTITLGSQNSGSNGLYKSAAVTVPDPLALCATGTGTCTFPAVAVVGNPESKFAIFVIAQDPVSSSPLVICLYQQ